MSGLSSIQDDSGRTLPFKVRSGYQRPGEAFVDTSMLEAEYDKEHLVKNSQDSSPYVSAERSEAGLGNIWSNSPHLHEKIPVFSNIWSNSPHLHEKIPVFIDRKRALAESMRDGINEMELSKLSCMSSIKRGNSEASACKLFEKDLIMMAGSKESRDIEINKKADELENWYKAHELEFKSYLDRTAIIKYPVIRKSKEGAYFIDKTKYTHRWSYQYISKHFKKLYMLQPSVLIEGRRVDLPVFSDAIFKRPFMFVTLTTFQNMIIPDQLMFLKKGYVQLIKAMRKKKMVFEYYANMDFHKTGYGHYHIIFFGDFSEKDKKWMKEIWSSLGYGSLDNVLDIKDKDKNGNSIKRIMSYFASHAGKVLKENRASYLPGWYRFHSMVYFMQHSRDQGFWDAWEKTNGRKHEDNPVIVLGEDFPGIRLFSCSKGIGKIMKLPVNDDAGKVLKMVDKDGKVLYDISENMKAGHLIDSPELIEHMKKLKELKKQWEDLSFD